MSINNPTQAASTQTTKVSLHVATTAPAATPAPAATTAPDASPKPTSLTALHTLQTGPKTDSFSPGNSLFVGALATQDATDGTSKMLHVGTTKPAAGPTPVSTTTDSKSSQQSTKTGDMSSGMGGGETTDSKGSQQNSKTGDMSGGMGGGETPDEPETPQNSITLSRLQDHLANSNKELDAMNVLTNPEKLSGGKFDGKTIFEAIAGDDGHITLKEAQEATAQTGKDLERLKKMGSHAPKDVLEKTEALNNALKVITMNGDFERLSGNKGYIDMDMLNKEKASQQEQVNVLTTLTTNGNFEAIAGDNNLISQKDVAEAAKNGRSDDVKKAAQWLTDKDHFGLFANPSKNDTGDGVTGTVDGATQQKNMGDCGFLSTTRAISETKAGSEILEKSIQRNSDGTYDVTFAGDSSGKPIHITEDDIKGLQNPDGSWKVYAGGDKDMSILAAAAEKYYRNSSGGKKGVEGQFPKDLMNLLSGDKGKKQELDKSSSADDIKKYLTENASKIGDTIGLTLVGDVGDNADWKPGGGHAFQISKIDGDTVSYTNPWDSSVVHTIKLDDLAQKIADAHSYSYIDSIDYS